MLFFIISHLKSARKNKSWRVVLSPKPVYSSISKLICNFYNLVIYHVLYFPPCTSTLQFPCFPFFYNGRTWKQVLLLLCFVLFRKRSNIAQLIVQAATAGNEEQFTLSNIIYITFQNCYFFFWSPLWSGCS